MNKKKLAIVSPHHWTGSYGGAEYQISLLVHELTKNHPELELHYLCKPSPNHIKPIDHRLHEVASQRWYSKYGSFFDAPGLYRTLCDIKPDYIYQRVGCAYTAVCAFYANKHDITMLWHIAQDLDVMPSTKSLIARLSKPHQWLEKKLLEYGLNHTTKIVTQKHSQAADLKKFYARQADKIIANFQPSPGAAIEKHPPPHVAWISNHKREKNPEIFLDLAERLSKSTNARFTMAGRAATSNWGKSIAARATNSASVNFVGEIAQNEVNQLLDSAHIMINTSDYEGFPNTFIQSWMRGVPVVSLYVDPDNLLNKNQIGVMTGNIEKLYIETKRLIEDNDLRDSMGATARDYALENHSLCNAEGVISLMVED